jgi:hypothetical protein
LGRLLGQVVLVDAEGVDPEDTGGSDVVLVAQVAEGDFQVCRDADPVAIDSDLPPVIGIAPGVRESLVEGVLVEVDMLNLAFDVGTTVVCRQDLSTRMDPSPESRGLCG